MDKITIIGRVYPSGYILNTLGKNISFRSDDGTLNGIISIKVKNSDISVVWEIENYTAEQLTAVWNHSRKLVTAMVDLISFRLGAAAIVVLDRYIDSAGNADNLAILEPSVAGISSSFPDDSSLDRVFNILIREQHLMVIMEDLISGISIQYHKTINCARCVEAIRQIIAGYEISTSEQWKLMRGALNVEREYLELIMNSAKYNRHGNPVSTDDAVIAEVMRRTWTIVDRFFHYRIGGNRELGGAQFPLLAD